MAVYTTIDNPELYFQTKVHTGTGSELAVTLDGSENMQPDFTWFKNRTQTYSFRLFDSVRGVTKLLYSDIADAEGTDAQGLKSWQSDGFTIGTDGGINTNTNSIVSWNWKESATAGFDIVSYAGTGSAKTESHSLSAVPKLIIVKNRSAADAWQVYHGANTAAPETDYLVLNTTAATADAADRWNDTAPTSSVFSLGDGVEVNTNTENYIAYCFSEKQGYSKFGSYIGNGNADGPFVYTGFRAAFIMWKGTASTQNWMLVDNKRDVSNLGNSLNDVAFPNSSQVPNDGETFLDVLSNGFKIRTTEAGVNSSGEVHIYMAFAEAPFVNSNGVPNNAR